MMYGKLCTEFYDADKRFAEDDEIQFYSQFIKHTDTILEPMCGSGRLLIPLLQAGYTIHGLDNSSSMLTSCKERARKLGLEPILYEQNIESFSLPQQYHLIFIPLGSFQLLYPRDAAYQALHQFKKHLYPGGKLILDLFIPWDALYENNAEERGSKTVGISETETIIHQYHNLAHKTEQYIESKAVYQKIINNQVVAEETEEMNISWYYRYEMELILEKCGFKQIDYSEAFFRGESHLIYVAE